MKAKQGLLGALWAGLVLFDGAASAQVRIGQTTGLTGAVAGTVVTRVFPPERTTNTKMFDEVTELAQAKELKEVPPAMVEGFAAAKVLTEAPTRAGKEVTTESITRALNGLRKLDLGGMEISFSPIDTTGINFVDIPVLDGGGKFRR